MVDYWEKFIVEIDKSQLKDEATFEVEGGIYTAQEYKNLEYPLRWGMVVIERDQYENLHVQKSDFGSEEDGVGLRVLT